MLYQLIDAITVLGPVTAPTQELGLVGVVQSVMRKKRRWMKNKFKYRAKLCPHSNSIRGEYLYEVEKKGWFSWDYFNCVWAKSPENAIKLTVNEYKNSVWTYGG